MTQRSGLFLWSSPIPMCVQPFPEHPGCFEISLEEMLSVGSASCHGSACFDSGRWEGLADSEP